MRSGALLRALRNRRGASVRLRVRSDAPRWLFTRRDPETLYSAAKVDAGVLQSGGLDLDLPGTLAAHEAFVADWDRNLEREVRWLAEVDAALVVADVPPLACAAASRAGVPSVAVANFSWDWILELYAIREARFAPIVARYARAYAEAERLYRLPLHGEFPAFRELRDVPLVAHRSARTREDTLRGLGLDPADERPLVVVSFGGFESAGLDPTEWDELSGYRFLGLGDPPRGLPASWTALPRQGAALHEDLVAACDVLLGKPGYSTCAEVLAHGTRFLHLPRPDFREVPVLEAGLAAYPAARPMPREDFLQGRWRCHLETIQELPRPAPAPADGADVIADALLERLGR